MIHRPRFACKAVLWYDKKETGLTGEDTHGTPLFFEASLLGRGCAVRGRDGCGRPVGSSAGPCFIRPRITARHFDGGFRLLPAVSARRWVGPVLHGRQAPCPALARFGRCRGTGGVCGAGTAFLHRAVQALGAYARAVHLCRVAGSGRGRRTGAALCRFFSSPAWPGALCLLLGHGVFCGRAHCHQSAKARLGAHPL